MTLSSKFVIGLLFILGMQSCIGDDIIDDRVPAQLRITNPISELKSGDTYQLEVMYTNIIGKQEATEVTYLSSDESLATISSTGLITGLSGGNVTITLSAESEDGPVTASMPLIIGANTVASNESRSGTLQTTSSYELTGGFVLSEEEDDLILTFDENWKTTDVLPGLYVYLTNNKNSNANALEISEVTVFEGAHIYTLPAGTGLNDYSHVLFYCKPFGVKVGDGAFDN